MSSLAKITSDKEQSEVIDEIMVKFDLERGVVMGVLGDIARMPASKESKGKIAARWGVSFGQMNTMKAMGRITIDEVRNMMVTKKLILADAADNALIDRFNDSDAVANMGVKDLVAVSKQMSDSALNLSNNSTGTPQQQINIGAIQMLIQRREERGEQKSALEILQERGVKVAEVKIIEPSEDL